MKLQLLVLLTILLFGTQSVSFARDSLNVRQLAQWSYDNLNEEAWCCAVSGDYGYFGAYTADTDADIHLMNISNASAPLEVGHFMNSDVEVVSDIKVVGNYAYLAADIDGLRILDVSDPANPHEVGAIGTGMLPHKLDVQGNYIYIADGGVGLRIVDITNPASPVQVGATNQPVWYVRGVAVSGNYAYLGSGSGFWVMDVSNPASPTLVGSLTGYFFIEEVVVSGNYAYVACSGAIEGIRIIDISNPAQPIQVGSYDTEGYGYAIAVQDQRVFLADYDQGLRVFDVSDPTEPVESGFYDGLSTSYFYDIAVSGQYAYVAGYRFFFIFDISATTSAPLQLNPIPTQFSLYPVYPNPFNNTANITFDLPHAVTVRLVVYDMLGRVMNTIYDGRLLAGSHQMQFNGNNLSSGTYFVKLESPEFNAVQKAVLVK